MDKPSTKAEKEKPVEIVDSDYQPSKAELNEDMRLRFNGTIEDAAKALFQPVDIQRTRKPT